MKKGLKIQHKILISVLLTTSVILIFIVGYIGTSSKKQIYKSSKELADSYSVGYAYMAEKYLNQYMDNTSYLVNTFEDFENIPENLRREVLSNIMKIVLSKNDKIFSVWAKLNPNSIDNLDSIYVNRPGSTILGNFNYVFKKDRGRLDLDKYIERDPDAVFAGSVFQNIKNGLRQTIIDPYYFSYSGDEKDEILIVPMVSPLVIEGEFFGIIGVDVGLYELQEMIDQYHPMEGSFSFLLSNSGQIVTFPDKNAIGKSITNIGFIDNGEKTVLPLLQEGENFTLNTEYHGENNYVSFASIKIGDTVTPWYLGVVIPNNKILQTANRSFYISIIVGILGLLILTVITIVISRNIANPIKMITTAIERISIGNVDETTKLDISANDEIAEMGDALNKYIDGYIEKTSFASQIGEGLLESDFHLLGEKDNLGKSLISIRESLKKAKKDESKRVEEDKKRRWHNEGIANFAELMRQNHDDLRQLSYNIVSNMVEYLEINQGGIFILNDDMGDAEHFELYAAYAYNKKKYVEKRIKKGIGLVGTCALEKKTIHMNNVPDNYISLQSGLGEANPKSLLIVPLMMEDHVLGVLELASLKDFEPYKIEFVEKIAESIASTISSVRINIKTNDLLTKSQQQAEEMSAQEEEMRQNMEELQATQEEATRRELELKNILDAVNDFLNKAELSLEGSFMEINEHFAVTFGYNANEIKEKSIETLIPEGDLIEFKNNWHRVQNGESHTGVLTGISKRGDVIHLSAYFAPIKDINHNISKVLFMAVKK